MNFRLHRWMWARVAPRRHAEALDLMARDAIARQRTPWVGGRNPWWVVGLAAVLVVSVPTPATAQTCDVVSADAEGVPLRIRCGTLRLHAVTPGQLVRWGEIEAALVETADALRDCGTQRHLLSGERDALSTGLRDSWAALDAERQERAAEARSAWTVWEVVGVSGTAAVALGVVGLLVGALAL